MSAIFPKWTNRLPLMIIIGGGLCATAVTAGVWYYFTPKYTRVGYQPIQPVPFSHATHAEQLGIDCRYCHSMLENHDFSTMLWQYRQSMPSCSACVAKSWFSNIP